MMIKWIFRLILITLLAAVLHYNLPHRDIVRITDTYEKRVDPGANSWFWSSGTELLVLVQQLRKTQKVY